MPNSNIYVIQYTPLDSTFSKEISCSGKNWYMLAFLQGAESSKSQTIQELVQYHDVTVRVSFFKTVITLYNFLLDHWILTFSKKTKKLMKVFLKKYFTLLAKALTSQILSILIEIVPVSSGTNWQNLYYLCNND